MTEPPRKRLVRAPTGGATRVRPTLVATAKSRTPSSQAWLERQLNDPFSAQARAEGLRSRAAFKLREIDDRYQILRRGAALVDLGCAPGGWLQVAVERGIRDLVGVDLLPVEPVPGAKIIQGDFTDPLTVETLAAQLGRRPTLVLSDMAPNTVGHRQTDHLRIMHLVEAAADFALEHLEPGGTLLAKAFQGGEMAELLVRLKRGFGRVRNVKPSASRAESSEVYILATDRKAGR
jgi:23S rRNA (uridine2552-2'-O)-methyltransferase